MDKTESQQPRQQKKTRTFSANVEKVGGNKRLNEYSHFELNADRCNVLFPRQIFTLTHEMKMFYTRLKCARCAFNSYTSLNQIQQNLSIFLFGGASVLLLLLLFLSFIFTLAFVSSKSRSYSVIYQNR